MHKSIAKFKVTSWQPYWRKKTRHGAHVSGKHIPWGIKPKFYSKKIFFYFTKSVSMMITAMLHVEITILCQTAVSHTIFLFLPAYLSPRLANLLTTL